MKLSLETTFVTRLSLNLIRVHLLNSVSYLFSRRAWNHMVNWIEFSTVLNLSHLRVDEEKVSHWAAATRFHRWAPSALMCLSCTALWTLLHCKKYGPRRFCTQKANILVEVYLFSISFHNMRPRFPLWFRYTHFAVGNFILMRSLN